MIITEGTIDYVEFPPLQEYLDAYTTVPGWYAVNHVYASGYLGISPYGGEGSLQTPFLDLSSSNCSSRLMVSTLNLVSPP